MSNQDSKTVLEMGNLILKGSKAVTMATSHKNTSKGKHKARLSAIQMSEIVKEAKKLVFLNSSKVATATKQSKDMMEPKETILFRNSSKRINHPHAARVKVYEPQ